VAFIWGRHPVYEALRARRSTERLYLAEGARPMGIVAEIVGLARAQNVTIQVVERRALDRLADGANHQGVIAEVAEYRYHTLAELIEVGSAPSQLPLVLALDSLEDPQNFGTLLRTAEAVGAIGAVIPLHRSVGVTPAVERASAGAVEFVRIARVTNLARALVDLKHVGFWIAGLAGDGDVRYDDFSVDVPLVLVVGAEGRGLSRLVRERCDILARIPMFGHVQSLNAAVAGSILLYDVRRRRDALVAKVES
jgi:23S rRNA (guanosine2251-2'-O)-methyltransferase